MGGTSEREATRASDVASFCMGVCRTWVCGRDGSMVVVLSWTVFKSLFSFVSVVSCSERRSSICSGWSSFCSRNATFRSRDASLIDSSSKKRRACSNGSNTGAEGALFASESVGAASEGVEDW